MTYQVKCLITIDYDKATKEIKASNLSHADFIMLVLHELQLIEKRINNAHYKFEIININANLKEREGGHNAKTRDK